jgi:hypothetical protein
MDSAQCCNQNGDTPGLNFLNRPRRKIGQLSQLLLSRGGRLPGCPEIISDQL